MNEIIKKKRNIRAKNQSHLITLINCKFHDSRMKIQ